VNLPPTKSRCPPPPECTTFRLSSLTTTFPERGGVQPTDRVDQGAERIRRNLDEADLTGVAVLGDEFGVKCEAGLGRQSPAYGVEGLVRRDDLWGMVALFTH